jgi:hypothetical protein
MQSDDIKPAFSKGAKNQSPNENMNKTYQTEQKPTNMESPSLDSDHSLTPIIDSDDFSIISKPRSESRQASSL